MSRLFDVRAGFLGAATALLAAPNSKLALYIAPTPAGDQSGSSWTNAAPLTAINSLISKARQLGAEILIRADAGTYSRDGAIAITNGGTAGAPVVIRGATGAGVSAKAEIIGGRTSPYDPAGVRGNDVFRITGGGGNLTFQFLRFRNQGLGCIRVGAPISNLTIEDCDAYNVQTFFDTLISGGNTDASVTGLTIRRCEGHGFSKRFMRIQYASNNILIEDCWGDSERQDKDNFAVGIGFNHTAHHAVLNRCRMENCIDTTAAYQNGDGFSGELNNHHITLNDCSAYHCTDGGVDFKGDFIDLIRFMRKVITEIIVCGDMRA